MSIASLLKNAMSSKERVAFGIASTALIVSAIATGVFSVKENSSYVPVRGGSFSEGIIGQPVMVNPILSKNQADRDISSLVYSPLSKLVSSSETDPDQRVYTVKLKEGLLWDDGKPLTSDDVIFTIKTIQNPDARSPFEKNWRGISVERSSELQVVFTLPVPYSFFSEILYKTPIIPRHIFSAIPVENYRLSLYSLKPVGSGPYKVKKIDQRRDGFITEYQLVPNPNYAGDPPFITNFYFKFYETENDLFKDLRLREINGFGSLSPLDKRFENVGNVKLEKIPMSRYYAIFFNPINNPSLKNKSVRKALDLAIDKNELVKILGDGNAFPINSPLVPLLKEKNTFENKYNQETARNLLEKAKVTNLSINLIVPNTDTFKAIGEFIKNAWTGIGMTGVTITPVDPDAIFDNAIKTRTYEAILFGNALENPLDFFPFWHSSQRLSPGLNLSFYQNIDVDKLIEKIQETRDETERENLANQAASLIENDVPAVFLYTEPYFYLRSEKLQGMNTNLITAPSDRFLNVQNWSVIMARVLK